VFHERLQEAIERGRSEGIAIAVLLIDLDNFKNINDTLGHQTGDRLLQEVAQRLIRCIRDDDMVARLGGDEFAAVLTGVTPAAVDSICQRIVQALGAEIVVGGDQMFITASIGVSLFPEDGEDGSALVRNADAAMYRAKDLGKNQFRHFETELKESMQRRFLLETGLRLALQQDQFRLVYQPKVRLTDGAIVGAEALLRWADPVLGNVSPAEFIPIAERAGLIDQIGVFVVRCAILDIVSWRRAGLEMPPISINISPSQLRDDNFGNWLWNELAQAGLPASCVTVELTEGALMEQGEEGMCALHHLFGRGIRVSIDDFGTGYSSLAYLKRMPISELKIDRSFIDGIASSADDRAIARAVLQLAHTLGLTAVAEGVENERQAAILREMGCDEAQGYYFHRPLEEPALRDVLFAACAACPVPRVEPGLNPPSSPPFSRDAGEGRSVLPVLAP
jgi:two-component system CheB/CheR fusion protein